MIWSSYAQGCNQPVWERVAISVGLGQVVTKNYSFTFLMRNGLARFPNQPKNTHRRQSKVAYNTRILHQKSVTGQILVLVLLLGNSLAKGTPTQDRGSQLYSTESVSSVYELLSYTTTERSQFTTNF